MRVDLFCLQRYTAWANRRLLEALRSCPAAQPEGLPLLGHLLAAEHVWLSRVQGRPAVHPLKPDLTVDGCEELSRENDTGYGAVMSGHDDAGWTDTIHYRSFAGQEFATPVGDILMQVLLHGAYHRGQIARALGRAGTPAVNTDLITYLRETNASVLI